MAEPASAFTWGEGGTQLSPTQLAARRQLAQAMQAQGMDYSPIKSPWQGLARVAQSIVGSAQSRRVDEDETAARQEAIAGLAAAMNGGATPAIAGPAAAAAAPIAARPTAAGPGADTSGKIYANDESSPLDPPSGADRDMAIRTIIAEAGNQPAAGQTGVAAVMRNRAVDGSYGGDTLPGVIRKPYAFEPWNNEAGREKMQAIPASDPRYARAGQALDAAYFGEDPTEGATHFVAPKAQAALGRPMPAWAKGESTTIGDHVFYSPDDAGPAAPVQVASAAGGPMAFAGPAAAAAGPPAGVATIADAMRPAPGGAPAASPSPAMRPGTAEIMKAISNPHLPPQVASMAMAQLNREPKERFIQETDQAGNIWNVSSTGQRTVALKKDATYDRPFRDDDGNLVQRDASGKISVLSAADKAPSSVSEYEYYKKNFKPGEQRQAPMDYETWATAKARAGATSINMGGGSDKQIFDAFDERAKEARSAATGLVALRNARASLDSAGGAITGAGADTKLLLTKVGAAFGITDPKAAENTETFKAAIAPQVAAMLKSTVGTTNISNSDREFAEKAAGGNITLEGNSIKRLLNIMEQASVARLQLHQEQLDAVYPDAATHKRERALFGVKVPAADAPPAPAGATKTGVKWAVE